MSGAIRVGVKVVSDVRVLSLAMRSYTSIHVTLCFHDRDCEPSRYVSQ